MGNFPFPKCQTRQTSARKLSNWALLGNHPSLCTVIGDGICAQTNPPPTKKQKFIDSFFERTNRMRTGGIQRVETVGTPEPLTFRCNLCPKMCANPGALANHKNWCHPQISVASTQGLFLPPTGNPASTNSPRPKPFWKQLMLLGACYIALFNVGQGTVKFVPYMPPVPKKDGKAKNKGCAHRARHSFKMASKILVHFHSS